MNKFSFIKIAFLAITILIGFSACDKDYNEIGANLIGSQNFSFESKEYTVATYSQSDSQVQSNNLPINQLGVYEDAFFGKTTASFVTQLELNVINPITPTGTIVVDKVELIVPYFANQLTSTTVDDVTTKTYSLNAIYPADKNLVSDKINLSVYQSGKFLNSFNPALGYLLPYRYFSNEIATYNTVGIKLNQTTPINTAENTEFQFNSGELTETTIDNNSYITKTKISPSLKLNLDTAHFKTAVIGAIASGKLVDNTVFKQHFRGLFFKVESIAGQKAMSLLNFANGKVTIFYTETNGINAAKKSLVMNMKGNTVNLFENDYGTSISGLPTSTTPVAVSEKMFVKGGAGFHSYIDLFGGVESNGIVDKNSAEFTALKQSNWIINEASLTFTVDNAFTGTNPYRLYLYDARNNKSIIDFDFDLEASTSNPKGNKPTFGGILYKDPITGDSKYKVRITEHIKNLIRVDTIKNVRLGLVVTEDINNSTKKYNNNIFVTPYNLKIPEGSVINPLGTILWGSNPSGSNNSKKVKFEIFYTKPN